MGSLHKFFIFSEGLFDREQECDLAVVKRREVRICRGGRVKIKRKRGRLCEGLVKEKR